MGFVRVPKSADDGFSIRKKTIVTEPNKKKKNNNKLHISIGTFNIIASITGVHESREYDGYTSVLVRMDPKRSRGDRDDTKRSADTHNIVILPGVLRER